MTERADQLLADGFARHASQWAVAEGANAATVAAVGRAAAALSLAVSEGHVCLMLATLAAASRDDDSATRRLDVAGWRATLLASGIVGTPEAPGAMPLILDAEDRLYLHRYFDYERRLATRLVQARHASARERRGPCNQRARTARFAWPGCSPPTPPGSRVRPTGSSSPPRSRCAAGSP